MAQDKDQRDPSSLTRATTMIRRKSSSKLRQADCRPPRPTLGLPDTKAQKLLSRVTRAANLFGITPWNAGKNDHGFCDYNMVMRYILFQFLVHFFICRYNSLVARKSHSYIFAKSAEIHISILYVNGT